ncbi:MAG TPA: retropepsin-like aspartic protease [Thermoplasmata archaeon]|nr:retropepsin-like aspartic protease [Thermoplasmata archaeon]
MSHIYADLIVFGKKNRVTLRKVMVDSGASYTVLSPETIRKLGGMRAPTTMMIELANGSKVRASACTFRVRVFGRDGPATVITFRGACDLIGVETLEVLGIRPDFRRGKVRMMRTSPHAVVYSSGPTPVPA